MTESKPRKLFILSIAVLAFNLLLAFPVFSAGFTAWILENSGTSNTLNDIWGIKSNTVFAVGESGTILLYDGSLWSVVSGGSTKDLNAVWGESSKDLYAVGESGTILFYGGSTWESVSSGTSRDLRGIWGSSASSIFTVGNSGTILHYDGTDWISQTSGVTVNLLDTWGTDDNHIFTVGESGTILHYNGTTWNSLSSGVSSDLFSIWGTDDSDVFAAGNAGTILHYNGSTWNKMSSSTKNDLYDIWGPDGSDIFAIGESGTIIHYDGTDWTSMNKSTSGDLLGIWGLTSSNIFAVGGSGTLLSYIPPVINSISTADGSQGATLDLSINGINLSGVTEVKFGAGIAVNSFTAVSSKEIEVNLTIVSDAATGNRDVTVTTPSGSFTLEDSFFVKRTPPLIKSISPVQDRQGATLNVTLTGRNFSGTGEVRFGEGISVNSFSVLSSSQVSANITIAADAATGLRDVSVTTTGGNDTLSNCFTVIPALPVINTVAPANGNQSSALNVTLNGAYFTGASQVQFGAGILVNGYTVISFNQIAVSLNILKDADIGPRSISVTTPGGSFVLPDGFSVIQALPQITSISPGEGNQGATLNVTISGSNLNGTNEVRLGNGIAVNHFNVLNSQQVQVEITLLAGTATGTRDVTISTPGGTASLSGGFSVKQGLPSIFSINPDQGNRGESLNVIISGNNLDGTTSVNFGSGIEVQSFYNLSQTQLSVNVKISDSADSGLRNVLVTTPGGTSSLGNSFSIKEKSLGTIILVLIWIGIALVIVLLVIVVRLLKTKRSFKL